MTTSELNSTQRYAAGALMGLALRQAQIHQTRPLGFPPNNDEEEESHHHHDDLHVLPEELSQLWTHPNYGLVRPIFRFLDIDPIAWTGLEETALSSSAKHHIGAFLRLLSEENCDKDSSEKIEQEFALSKAVDAATMSLLDSTSCSTHITQGSQEVQHERDQRSSSSNMQEASEADGTTPSVLKTTNPNIFHDREGKLLIQEKDGEDKSESRSNSNSDKPLQEAKLVCYQRKVAVLFDLLSACLADTPEDEKKASRIRKGYDARHRIALRLLATWLDVNWIKMEAMEIMVACSAMAAAKGDESHTENVEAEKGKWSKWKRGGIIGAAALTGGTLLAVTGGLAAPAIAAGFSALAPTLGALVPVIGASGFAAAASAAGSVAGSVAVAASFGAAGASLSGSKMARRIGGIDEFEFKPIGENHKNGRLAVGIFVSGFVFEEEDFVKPWAGKESNLERYALQWESKNLITVSTAIQDWLTSSLTMELMKQGAMLTVLNTLVAALAWPSTLLAATNFIDSKWSIAVDRSDKAGQLLADCLLKGLQGNRPVTLIGFSLGARAIFKCLQHLAKAGDRGGLVERVVLLGAPVSIKDEHWEDARKVLQKMPAEHIQIGRVSQTPTSSSPIDFPVNTQVCWRICFPEMHY
ncbi:transmembrane and coiled-coil domain-containing protein 4 isoform X2 [Amborella trichopoda]|uniref:transmembrane and coiled-coil domain-containing protein 4 isoform X2 n=1 Tax=Amborella trichopoda TaxID=13333 RepID=UPI0009BCB336|nr:transmembrane and coiled-coil domain-containing protein 4 isoform X2 [Amborella trichopoda]|eukprot:XP_020532325.1 transmembrane and coiled-coil domain-containing protein 4 isoform X2 [Amborella trichopoda]